MQITNSHQYTQLSASASNSSTSKNVVVEVPPQLRDIVAWSHTTLPNSAGALTVNGVVPKVVIVDTGANYVMIGKKLAEQMEITDAEGDFSRGSHTTQLKETIIRVEVSLNAKWQSFYDHGNHMRRKSSFMSWSTTQQLMTFFWVHTRFIASVASLTQRVANSSTGQIGTLQRCRSHQFLSTRITFHKPMILSMQTFNAFKTSRLLGLTLYSH